MIDIPFTPLATALPAAVPFVGPEQQEREMERKFAARLGANESLSGPSPLAQAAMAKAAADAWIYGDPTCFDLRHALAAHHMVSPDCIVVGEGIDGLQGYLVRLFVAQGDTVVTSDGAYPTFNYHAVGFGGTLHKVPYKDDHEDPDALIARAKATHAKLIYFANPDNPMGTWHSASTVQKMIDRIPVGTTLILDEAYIDTAPTGSSCPPTAPAIDTSNPQVVRMRTFSKAYGLAGLRVGYAIGHPDVIRGFEKVRNHFGMGRIQQAGALAALADQDYLMATVDRNATDRANLSEFLAACDLKPIMSATNFVTADTGHDGAYAQCLVAALGREGVFVRMPGVAPLNRCIRVSVPNSDALDVLERAMPRALEAVQAFA
ncbi:MAG: pyridoxal phosphate-dependent aminotransferase [Pseudomonadota bacterium]